MHPSVTPEAVTLLVKPDCQLCLAAEQLAREICAEFGLVLSKQSMVDDQGRPRPEYSIFADEVPVLLIDGVQRDFWKIDPVRMRRLLLERQHSRAE